MRTSRRVFMRRIGGLAALTFGGTQLGGCLGGGESDGTSSEGVAADTTSSGGQSEIAPSDPGAVQANGSPVWQPSPTIEFVEGTPSVVPVRHFVQDSNLDQLVIRLQSGTLIPGITWNPDDGTIAYDGRPLGAKPDQPVVVSGLVFTADDGRN